MTATATRPRHLHEAARTVTHDPATEKPRPRRESRAPRGRAGAQRRRRHERAVSMPRREDVMWLGLPPAMKAAGRTAALPQREDWYARNTK